MVDAQVSDELVLIRTRDGQTAAFDDVELDPSSRRLLRLVNGYTPLGSLATRLPGDRDGDAVASELLRRGLVAVRPH
jgi:hypothetical protein